MESEKYICLGQANKLHGLKGFFKLQLFNFDAKASVLHEVKDVYLEFASKRDKHAHYRLKDFKPTVGDQALSSLEGIDSCDQLKELLPFKIYIKREDLPVLSEGQYYLCDLIGLDVYSFLEQEKLGVITSVQTNNASQDIITYCNPQGSHDLLLDYFVKSIDWQNLRVYIQVPEEIS